MRWWIRRSKQSTPCGIEKILEQENRHEKRVMTRMLPVARDASAFHPPCFPYWMIVS
jgi:hypothetical protein